MDVDVFLNETVNKELKKDSALAQQFTHARLRQIAEGIGLKIEGDRRQPKPSTIDDYIERAKIFNGLKEVIGVKEPGLLNSLLDPKVIVEVLQLISDIWGNKQVPPINNIMILVGEDGKEREMTRKEYEQLKARDNNMNLKDMIAGELISSSNGNDAASKSETLNKADEKDQKTNSID